MNLPNELISQFAKLSTNQNEQPKSETLYGTAIIYGDKTYVVLDGSNSMTPAVTTSEIKAGERVTVLIKDHTATITGNISDPSASSESMKELSHNQEVIVAQMGIFETLIADKITTEQLNATVANIETLIAGKATIKELDAVKATIKDLDVSELRADMAEIETLIAGKVSTEELEAVKATIKDLDVGILQADIARIEEAVILKADITELDAIHAEIDFLESDIANIETLVGGHLTMENIQSLVLTSSKVTVEDAFIKDAMIDTVSASKLYAGTINTNLVKLQSSDGSLNISGTLQQFKDKDGNVRIQIGKDAKGDFTFALYGADGKGQLINQDGITSSAIGDGIIVDDMVADDAGISGSKLDINSVVEEINGSSKTIKSSKIYLDEQEQTLTAAFDTMTTTVINTNNKLNQLQTSVNTQSTALNVAQGKIDTLITNTTITKSDGETVQLKDEYSSTVQTVNKLQTDLGSLTTTVSDNKKSVESKMATVTASLEEISGSLTDISEDIETISGDVTKVTTRVAKAEQTLTADGLTTIIGEHYTTKDDVNTLVTSKGYATSTQVTQTKDSVINTFRSMGGYNLLYNGDFKRGFKHWSNPNNGATLVTNIACPKNSTGIKFQGELTIAKTCYQRFDIYTHEPFTLSFWQYTSKSGELGTTNPYVAGQAVVTYSDDSTTYHSAGAQTKYDSWERKTITITPSKPVKSVLVRFFNRDSTKTIYYTNAMVEHGSTYSEFSPNPNEVFDGVTTIDKYGVRVEQSDYNGHTRMESDGFYVNNGTEDVISVTANGSVFKGKVIIQSGSSVPTSTLTGTISSSQLNSSITNDISTAKSTANSVNTTITNNKSKWDNAYNRILDWAYGDVSGETTIDGGVLQTGTVVAAKIAAGAITTAKLDAGAVTTAKLGAGAVTADKIDAGAITAEKIAAGAITADMITSGYFSGNMIKGGTISAADEINFVGGPLLKGNYGDLGVGLLVSAPEIHFKYCDNNVMEGSWTFKNGNVTVGSGYSLTVDSDKTLGKKSLYAPNGTKTRSYLKVGNVLYQSDTDFKGLLLTDVSGAYAKLACLRVEATGDMTCNSLWANTKVYAANVALTSDERLKTDIRYVDQEIQNEGESGLVSPNVKITTKDMHEFIELIPLASYRMKEEVNSGIDYTYYGFVAQDILYSKVGSELVEYGEVIVNDISYDEDGNEIVIPRKEERLRYSENKFIAFICGALKEEIAQRKALERKLEELTHVMEHIRNLE